jgi:hypothetical protein
MILIEPVVPIAPIVVKGLDDLVRSDFESFRNIWFDRLLISTAVVVVGLLFELPEILQDSIHAIRDLRHGSTPAPEVSARVKLLVSVGWLLIVVGVVGEFVADSFVSKADGIVQIFDETLIADAQRKTGLASARAASAFERAAQTEREASQENERAAKAEQQAQQENERAAKALDAAETARKEAEGFQLQIAQANEHAANAEERTKEAELELARIQTPRSLIRVPELTSALESFKGTEYVFVSVFQDEESIYLLRAIDDVLQKAGWKRGKSVAGFPGINVYGTEERNFTVPVGFNIGIQISTDSTQPIEHLESIQVTDLPLYLQAAATLKVDLSQCISPLQDNSAGKMVDVQTGASTTIRIAVGRKP